MAKELHYNLEKLKQIRDETKNIATDLSKLNGELQTALTELRSQWNTPAGKTFFDGIDMDWTAQVDKYIEVTEKMQEVLQEVMECYQEVTEAARKLALA